MHARLDKETGETYRRHRLGTVRSPPVVTCDLKSSVARGTCLVWHLRMKSPLDSPKIHHPLVVDHSPFCIQNTSLLKGLSLLGHIPARMFIELDDLRGLQRFCMSCEASRMVSDILVLTFKESREKEVRRLMIYNESDIHIHRTTASP